MFGALGRFGLDGEWPLDATSPAMEHIGNRMAERILALAEDKVHIATVIDIVNSSYEGVAKCERRVFAKAGVAKLFFDPAADAFKMQLE